jgi:hypothetical protein
MPPPQLLHLPRHPQRPRLQVDMTPQQPQRLTLPQTQAQRGCPTHPVALDGRGIEHRCLVLLLTDGPSRAIAVPSLA